MFLLLFVLISCIPSYCYEVEDGLVSVLVVFRHGERTPIKTYPNDPYRNASFWPEGFGQLTNTGKMQHFLLGRWFRDRYKNFLPEQYSEDEIYVRSTDVDRTLMSVEANLAGLFPPKNKQIWKSDLAWQPIPIHTTPEIWDNILAMKYPCDKYSYLSEKLQMSPEFVKIKQENQDLYNYLSKHSGRVIDNLLELLYLYDTLNIEKSLNFTLPEWTKTVFPGNMTPWANFIFAVDCYTPELARLKVGPLLYDIVNHFSLSTSGKGYKFIAYSAHDVTIANVLKGLQLFEYHCPPYTATILFELRYLNDTYFVNMLYKNSSNIVKLTLMNCSFYCPLQKFTEILEPLLITSEQWKDECKIQPQNYSYFILQSGLFIIGLAFLIIFSIFLTIRFILRVKASRNHEYVPVPSQENMHG